MTPPASEQEAKEACEYLRAIIEAAETSNQAGEDEALRAAEAVRLGRRSKGEAMAKPKQEAAFVYPDGWLPGMSLRDYFAGQALAGLLYEPHSHTGTPSDVAEASYAYADAMIAARDASDT